MAERIKEMTEQYLRGVRQAGERVWEVTQQGVSAAGSRAAWFGRVAQLKLELSSVEKRIEERQAQLGKAAFWAWKGGDSDIFRREDVVLIVGALDDLDHRRDALAQELEEVRAEQRAEPPGERASEGGEERREEYGEEERHL